MQQLLGRHGGFVSNSCVADHWNQWVPVNIYQIIATWSSGRAFQYVGFDD